MSVNKADVVIIGGGPGGYTAAERVAQLDGRVVLVEKDRLGGNCLNRGCIPLVALLRSAQVFSLAKTAKQFGVKVGDPSLEYETLMKRKDELVEGLVGGTERRIASYGVVVIRGRATLAEHRAVEILKEDGGSETLRPRSIIVATGSRPSELEDPRLREAGVLSAEQALHLERPPATLAVVGCDYIGVQLACLFNRLGTEVTIIEAGNRLLLNEDEEMAGFLQELLVAHGIHVLTEAKTTSVHKLDGKERTVALVSKDGTKDIHAEEVVFSAGRKSNTEGLGLEKAGVAMNDSGGIIVDGHMRTNIPNIYAVGDAVGKFMLAHIAMAEGTVAAECAMGRDTQMDYKGLPRCLFTVPEMATVGLTELEATEKRYKVRVSRVPLELNGFANITGQTEGLIKVVSDAEFGEVLGVQILGPNAQDLIHEAALGIRLEMTVEDMAKTIHIHPSLGEALKDAAWRLYNPII